MRLELDPQRVGGAARISLGGAAALVVGLGLALAASPTEPDASPEPAAARPARAVSLESVALRSVRERVVVPGVVEARSRAELAFEVSGRVVIVDVDEGDRVEAGARIAELDLDDLTRELELARATLRSARARAREAQAVLARQRELLEANTISTQAYDHASAGAEIAAAAAREAELRVEVSATRLAKATLRAPLAGHVERRLIERHEYVEAGAPAFVLTELDPVRVRAAVPDRHARLLRLGAAARVRSPAWPDVEFAGHVAQVDVAADRETRTWPFEVEVPNPGLRLRPEIAVDVAIESDEERRVLALPLGAVLRDSEERPFCFVARGPASPLRAERRPVELGDVVGDRVVVAAGVELGERVVVRGQHFIHDGDAVLEAPHAGAP